MPITPNTVQHVRKVAREISQRWTSEERRRRAHLADVMQARLMQLAGAELVPVPVIRTH